MTDQRDAEFEQRTTRRAFIRNHHPDAGGDHETFITGLADLDAAPRSAAASRLVPVIVTPRQTWPTSLTTIVLRRLRRRRQPPRVH